MPSPDNRIASIILILHDPSPKDVQSIHSKKSVKWSGRIVGEFRSIGGHGFLVKADAIEFLDK